MAQSHRRTDTVGSRTYHPDVLKLRRSIQRSQALRQKNGKWQVRKLLEDWCLITPSGKLIMTGQHKDMLAWAFRMVRIVSDEGRPF